MRSAIILFWIEVAFASLSSLGFMVTLFVGNWIELLFGVDPDQGDGTLERFVVLGCLAVTATVMALLATRNRATARRALAEAV